VKFRKLLITSSFGLVKKPSKVFLAALVVFAFLQSKAQVKIGNNPVTVDSNAVLELESSNKGFLMARVQLVNDTLPDPLADHVVGMMVYNIDTADVGVHRVLPGIYFNSGKKWIPTFSSAPQLFTERTLVPITSNGQTVLNFPGGLSPVTDDTNFFLYRNGVLLLKGVDYDIDNGNQIKIISSSFALEISDELYAISKSLK